MNLPFIHKNLSHYFKQDIKILMTMCISTTLIFPWNTLPQSIGKQIFCNSDFFQSHFQ